MAERCDECGQTGTHLGTCSRSAMNDPAHPFHAGAAETVTREMVEAAVIAMQAANREGRQTWHQLAEAALRGALSPEQTRG